MSAVLRVKRHLMDNPIDTIVLSRKRKKTESNSEKEDFPSPIFKFAATVESSDENFTKVLSNAAQSVDLKTITKPVSNPIGKSREKVKQSALNNRYKLVNYFRALDDDKTIVFDVESNDFCHKTQEPLHASISPKDQDEKPADASDFVYDVYFIDKAKNSDLDYVVDNLDSFSPLDVELVCDSYRNYRADGEDDSDSPIGDEYDSNDENNERNDYPDEEDTSDSDDLAGRFHRMAMGDNELSSDGDDENLVYGEDSLDTQLFGKAYARYKRRVLLECDTTLSSEENSSDSEEEPYND